MDTTERKTWATKAHQVGSILSLLLAILTWATPLIFYILSLWAPSEIINEKQIMSPAALYQLLGLIIAFWISFTGTIIGVATLVMGLYSHIRSKITLIGTILSGIFLFVSLVVILVPWREISW